MAVRNGFIRSEYNARDNNAREKKPVKERLYLDSAATGWPKHPAVLDAIEQSLKHSGAAAGRGSYRAATASNQTLARCRQLAAQLFQTPADGCWVLTPNGTASLNLAIHGLLRSGDHVLTTAAEHNSVLRPLHWLQQRANVDFDVVPLDSHGGLTSEAVIEAIRDDTRLIVMNHGSNVTGAVYPVEAVAQHLQQRGRGRTTSSPQPLLLIDTAQTAGQWPFSWHDCPADLIAMPGHKSLGGPLGTGLLFVGPRASSQIEPLLQGGTGSSSESLEMPQQLPERLEPGNQNVPAFAGLAAGLQIVLAEDLFRVAAENQRRVQSLATALRTIPGVRVFCAEQLPILSLTIAGFQPHDLANILDCEFNLETRAGLHCAPLIHQALGTAPAGTLRISFTNSTPQTTIDTLLEAVSEIANTM